MRLHEIELKAKEKFFSLPPGKCLHEIDVNLIGGGENIRLEVEFVGLDYSVDVLERKTSKGKFSFDLVIK